MDYATLAQSNAANPYAGVTEAPAPSFTDSVGQRLANIHMTISEAHSDLLMLNDRMFGGVPTQGANSVNKPPTAPGRAEAIHEALDLVQQIAAQVQSQARALNSRL